MLPLATVTRTGTSGACQPPIKKVWWNFDNIEVSKMENTKMHLFSLLNVIVFFHLKIQEFVQSQATHGGLQGFL